MGHTAKTLYKETLAILHDYHFDIRAVTMGINLATIPYSIDTEKSREKLNAKISIRALLLTEAVNRVARRYGVKVANRRISVTPIGSIASSYISDRESPEFQIYDINWKAFFDHFKEKSKSDTPIIKIIKQRLLESNVDIKKYVSEEIPERKASKNLKGKIVGVLNSIAENKNSFKEVKKYPGSDLDEETKKLIEKGVDNLTDDEVKRLNRNLIAASFPNQIPKHPDDFVRIALAMDNAIQDTGVDIIGGFSILGHKSLTPIEKKMLRSIPEALKYTNSVCSSINVASTKSGINMEAIKKCSDLIIETSVNSKEKNSFGCAKFVIFSNMPEDNPFMAGAIHGFGEGDSTINIGISGPGVILAALKEYKGYSIVEIEKKINSNVGANGEVEFTNKLFQELKSIINEPIGGNKRKNPQDILNSLWGKSHESKDKKDSLSNEELLNFIAAELEYQSEMTFGDLSQVIKKATARISAVGELIQKEVVRELNRLPHEISTNKTGELYKKIEERGLSEELQALANEVDFVEIGIVDISLASTFTEGDSVAEILKDMGILKIGAPGTTAALAMLIDAVKKGGVFSATNVGGLSGTFIPVSEDKEMAESAGKGYLTIEKLEALTSVCSVGMDMFAAPGDLDRSTLAGIIADEMAIGVINNKATAVRIIPVKEPVYKLEIKKKDATDWEFEFTDKVVFYLNPITTISWDNSLKHYVIDDEDSAKGEMKEKFIKLQQAVHQCPKKEDKFNASDDKRNIKRFALYPQDENLWGEAYIMEINKKVIEKKNEKTPSSFFIEQKGKIPAPIRSLTN